MLVCPVCRDSRALRLARSTGRLDGILRLLQFYSYRCDSCQKRFRHFGKQTLETAPAEPLLPPIVADPTTFKTLRFEGDNSLPKAKRELEKVEVTEDGRPKPILLARTWDVPTPKGTSLSNPLAMAPLELEPHELPVREAATERFDPLVLLEEVGEDEAPMRAEGDHIFDPLSMENKVLERAIEVNATRSPPSYSACGECGGAESAAGFLRLRRRASDESPMEKAPALDFLECAGDSRSPGSCGTRHLHPLGLRGIVRFEETLAERQCSLPDHGNGARANLSAIQRRTSGRAAPAIRGTGDRLGGIWSVPALWGSGHPVSAAFRCDLELRLLPKQLAMALDRLWFYWAGGWNWMASQPLTV